MYYTLQPYICLLLKSSLKIVWLYFLKQPSKWISNIYFVDINLILAVLIVSVCFEFVYILYVFLDSELRIYLISLVDINLISTDINYSCLKMLISTYISRWYQQSRRVISSCIQIWPINIEDLLKHEIIRGCSWPENKLLQSGSDDFWPSQ